MAADPTREGIRLGSLADYIGYYLRLAQDASFQAFAARVGRGDLRPGDFTLLTLIQQNPGTTQTAISQASGRDKSTLTPALRTLEERGYIGRKRVSHDRRAYQLCLTTAGEEAIAQLAEHALAHDKELDRLIGPENKAVLIRMLRKIADGFADP